MRFTLKRNRKLSGSLASVVNTERKIYASGFQKWPTDCPSYDNVIKMFSIQGLYSLEKPLNLTACLEKSLNSTACLEKPLNLTACLEKSLNSTACLEKPLNLTACLVLEFA